MDLDKTIKYTYSANFSKCRGLSTYHPQIHIMGCRQQPSLARKLILALPFVVFDRSELDIVR